MFPDDHCVDGKWKRYSLDLEFADGELQLRGDQGARTIFKIASWDVSGWTPVSFSFGPVNFRKIDQVDEFYRWLERHPHAELVEHVPLDFKYPPCPPGVVC